MKPVSGLKHAVMLAPMLMLSACTSTSPDKLQTASSGDIRLAQDLNHDYSKTVRYTLAAGPYKAWKQNAAGVYYLGPPKCHSQTFTKASMWSGISKEMVGRPWFVADCGIFVPADKAKPPKIYTIVGTQGPPPAQLGSQALHPGSAQIGTDPAATQSMTQTIMYGNPSLQGNPAAAGIGAGIGMAIVAGMAEAERGNIAFHPIQFPGTMLQDAIGLHSPKPAGAPAAGTASPAPSAPPAPAG